MGNWKKYILEESSKENKLTKKQENILIASVELISEKGYDKVSTAEIAQRAGVAEGTIFRQYKTKKDLLNAIVKPSFMKFFAPGIIKEFVEQIFTKDYISFEEFISTLVEDRYNFAKKNTPLVKIVAKEIINQENVREEIKELFVNECYESLAKIINKFKEKEEIIDIPSMTVFRIIIGNIMGYFIPRFVLYPDMQWDDEKEKQITIECIVKSLNKNKEL